MSSSAPGPLPFPNGWRRALPPQAVFLTDTRHNNEVASLAGRNVVCGSPSYLFYHGLPYDKSQRAVQIIYEHQRTPSPCWRTLGWTTSWSATLSGARIRWMKPPWIFCTPGSMMTASGWCTK